MFANTAEHLPESANNQKPTAKGQWPNHLSNKSFTLFTGLNVSAYKMIRYRSKCTKDINFRPMLKTGIDSIKKGLFEFYSYTDIDPALTIQFAGINVR